MTWFTFLFGSGEYTHAFIGELITLGTAIYGAVSSRKGSKEATRAANTQAQQAAEADAAALEFSKQQYADWKAVFGDVAKNLSSYYERLGNSDYATVRGLEAFEMEKDRALTRVRETLDQRGLGTSGAAVQVEQDFAELTATERARIRADAPREAAREQLSFLTLGMGQNPAGVVQSTLTNSASRASERALLTSELAGQAARDRVGTTTEAVKSVGTVLEDIFNRD